MATIVTRSGKGSPLTNTEVDSNFTNLNTDKLELSGGTMTGNLSLGDNDKAIFGAGNDLEIYHTGSTSYIDEQGTGGLVIRGTNLFLRNSANENYLGAIADGPVTIYYDNSEKLATTSTGIDVTGNIAVSGTVDGRDIATNIPASLGTAGQVLTVNSGASAGEWADAGGGSPDLYTDNYTSGTKPVASSSTNGVAIGRDAIATNTNSLALGYTSEATGSGAFSGAGGHATGSNSIAIGGSATASASLSSAYGKSSLASSLGSTAFGYDSHAQTNNYATALGYKASASGTESIGIATSNNTTSYGASGTNSIAMGLQASAAGGIALGSYSSTSSGTSVAIGNSASTSIYSNAVAIGRQASSTSSFQITLGHTHTDVKISSAYTLPKVDGSNGQVLTTNGSGVISFATPSGGGGASEYTIDNKTAAYTVVSGDLGKILNYTSGTVDVTLTALSSLTTGFYVSIWNSGTGVISIKPNSVDGIGVSAGNDYDSSDPLKLEMGTGVTLVNSGTYWQIYSEKAYDYYHHSVTLGANAKASNNYAMALGNRSTASSVGAIAIGTGQGHATTASNSHAVAIGLSTASGAGAIAVGKSLASGANSIAGGINQNSTSYGTSGVNSVAFGTQARATNNSSASIGQSSIASGYQSAAYGYNAVASGQDSFAGGPTTDATATNSTALGKGAQATHANATSVGYNAATSATNQVSIGASGYAVKISSAYTLPTSDGTNGQVMTTDGSGSVTFADAGGGGGGADLYTANESSPSAQPSATGANSVAIGDSAVASGADSFAIGDNADATSGGAIAIGTSAQSTYINTVAIGESSSASGNRSMALGRTASASADYSTAIGLNSSVQGSVTATGAGAMALGGSRASGVDSFAATIDNNTTSYGASGANSIAMGDRAKASGSRGIAIGGYNPQATGASTLAFGYQALASATYASGIGYQSKATGQYSWAANTSLASGNYSTALGISDNSSSYGAQHVSSVAIGYHAVTTADKQIALGDSTAQVKISGAYTLPTSDGSANQVLTTNGSGVISFATPASGGGGADLYTANESSPTAQPSATGTNAIAIGDSAVSTGIRTTAFSKSRAAGWDSIAGAILNNTTTYGTTSEGNIAFGEKATVTGSASQAIGKLSYATGSQSMGLGYTATATGLRSYAFGYGATASNTDSVSIGRSVTSTANNQVNIGGDTQDVRISEVYTLPKVDGTASGQVLTTNGSGVVSWATPSGGGGGSPDLFADNDVDATAPSATGNNSVAIGPSSEANSDDATAFGYRSEAKASKAVAIGEGRAGGTSATAISIGTTSTAYGATGQNSVAIGYQAKATAYLSFGLGQNSVATEQESFAIGKSLASARDSLAMAIDNNSTSYGASGNNSVAIAQSAAASGQISVAIGKQARASGVQSLSIGSGTCSNNKSISLGFSNTVDGQGAVAIGVGAKTWGTTSKIVFGANYGYSDGRLQSGIIQVHNNTTDATPVVLSSNSTSTAGSSNQLILPNNSSFTFTGIVSAREKASEGTDVGAWEVKGVVRREGSASTTTLVNSVINEINVPTGWAVAVSADTTNGALAITVTGVASTNIRWSTTLYTTEVMYA